MGFEIVKESYAGGIKEISIGQGAKAITVGGETCYPFYQFEGNMPNKPKIAMEIWDMVPEDWPAAALSHFKDVISDPAAWAKKCVNEFGAEMIVLQLKSTDPNGNNASAESAIATVKKVLGAINVPLIVWGSANAEKDEETFKKLAEACQDAKLTIGPVDDKNYKSIGAAAMGYGHTVISSSPIDVNLAKQINILLENLGVPMNRIIVDPTTGGLGYGLEYSYSVMERLRMAALTQGDDKLQFPLINNLGNEVWKCKEAKQPVDEAPTLGDPEKRAILMEAVGAVAYLMAGSDILIMRHPEAIRLVKAFIGCITDGGTATEVAPIKKQLDDINIDFAAIAPKPDLKIEEEKKAEPKKAAPKKAAPAKEDGKKAEPKKAAPQAAAKKCILKTPPPQFDQRAGKKAAPAAAATAAPAGTAISLDLSALKEEIRSIIRAELKTEAKPEAVKEVKAKAKPDVDAKKKAEEEAMEKAQAEARAKREEEESALRFKRAQEREKHAAERAAKEPKEIPVTVAATQASELMRIKEKLDRIHRRIPLY